MRPDQRAADNFRVQQGVITRKQAIEAGLSDAAIRHRLESGRWLALTAGVYASADAPATWERQLTAALLSRPGSVAAGTSAAFLHRFTGFTRTRPTIMAAGEINARLSIARVIRVTDFKDVATTMASGFPVTSVAETLWTLARSTSMDALSEMVDQQVSMGRTDPSQLSTVLDRIEGTRQRGLTRFRSAVASIDPSAHSTASNVLEALLYRLLDHRKIPAVSRQHPFLLDEPSRVDAFIPSWGVVVEADGRNWHTRQADFQRDRERDNHLATLGIVVIRFTYEDLTRHADRCRRILIQVGRNRRALNVV